MLPWGPTSRTTVLAPGRAGAVIDRPRVAEIPLSRVAVTRGKRRTCVPLPSVTTMTDQIETSTEVLDEIFDALSHPYRRRILTRLHDHNPRDESSFSTDSVADDTDDEDRLLLEIHHQHLPKLAEAGFVDWDREEKVVRRGPRIAEIAPLVELMVEHRDELPAGWP